MDLKTISALAVKMKINKEQFNSFKYFVYTKYEKQLQISENQLKVDEVLKGIYDNLPQSKKDLTKNNNILYENKKTPKYDKINFKKKKKIENKNNLNERENVRKSNNDRILRSKGNNINIKKGRLKSIVSKNKIGLTESNILKLKTDFIRQPHSIFEFCEKLQWDVNKFILIINQLGFNDLNPSSILKLEYIEPIAEAVLDRRRHIVKWESEIVTKNVSKTKPNYFKLLVNPIGTKR